MSDADVAILGAGKLDDNGAELWQTIVPITDDDNDTENLGELQVFQSLGVTSLPSAKDENGYAECLMFRNVGGRSAVCSGARDTRSKVAAGLAPGDTALHSTGPEEAAQIRCLEKKRAVVAFTKDSSGDSMMLHLDGKNDKVHLTARGAVIEIDPDGNISLTCAGGAAILLQGSNIFLNGTVRLPGMQPGQSLMMGPPTGQPAGNVAVLLMPVGGVGK